MTSSTLAKARIFNKDQNDALALECKFNPKEYSVSRQNSWTENKTGKNQPSLTFGGGQAASLQLQLFFDTCDTKQDVRDTYTNKLWALMEVNPELNHDGAKKGRPPHVMFRWDNKNNWFVAVITSLKLQFTLFHHDGTPLRATADVTFQQVRDPKEKAKQNPTSGGEGGERVYRVSDGDTLALIAYRHYGDATQWRTIADANKLVNVRRLSPGTMLVIPND